MMLIITCVRGSGGKFDKNGAIWCILSVPKLVIIHLKINIFFWIINQQPKFCAIFFSKINPDGYFGTIIKTFTFYMGDRGGGGLIALRSQRYVKKWRLYFFYNKYHIPDAKIYPVMMWIQIHARGGGGCRFFY